jgi:lipoprotein NlpD
MKAPGALLLLALVVAGCAQNSAPVVDKPVADWSLRKTPGNTGAPAEPAAKPSDKSGANAATAARAGAGVEADARPDVYVVKRGDTLYGIALDHGQSYRDIAAWNGIANPDVILVGQQLRVRPPAGWVDRSEAEEQVVTQPLNAPPTIEAKALEAPAPPPLKTGPKALRLAYSERALAQVKGVPYKEAAPVGPQAAAAKPAMPPAATTPTPTTPAPPAVAAASPGKPAPVQQAKIEQPKMDAPPAPAASAPRGDLAKGWVWPARGPLLHAFNAGANPKGIAIAGEAGQPVFAAAPGKVVYSGSGLRGYGKLVIIKHDDTYLSVYAHNRELLVKEGQRVAQGQKIAEMGNTDAERVALHFEIRKLGKPVDPLQLLPQPG